MVNPFPMKLYTMLQESEEKGWEDIVRWAPNGLSFFVHDVDRFMKDVLPTYFNQTKFKSFQRQLNFYGFTRNMNASLELQYCHRYLIRGNQEMSHKIIRTVGQDKSLEKESSAASSSPSTSQQTARRISLTESMDLQPIPVLPVMPDAVFTTTDYTTPMFEESPMQPPADTTNLCSYLAPPPPEEEGADEMIFLPNFDDTPIALEEPVSFGETQFYLLSGPDGVLTI